MSLLANEEDIRPIYFRLFFDVQSLDCQNILLRGPGMRASTRTRTVPA